MGVKRENEKPGRSVFRDGVQYVFPLAHIVVRVSVSVTIVVSMKEATKEALALHKLRKGDRERGRETDSFVWLCVPSERVLSQEGPLVSDIRSPK